MLALGRPASCGRVARVLAEARENQCWLFRYFGQTQNGVAACRESRDIFSAAGDRKNEARALRAWADAISLTDAPESIRLYQQAQVLFRSVGSQAGVAEVLNNLGDVYYVQGDPATAEKMQRQALAIYRLTDRKRQQAAVTGNVAGDRMEQGDLRGASEQARARKKPACVVQRLAVWRRFGGSSLGYRAGGGVVAP